jgi:hypothetical protein
MDVVAVLYRPAAERKGSQHLVNCSLVPAEHITGEWLEQRLDLRQ